MLSALIAIVLVVLPLGGTFVPNDVTCPPESFDCLVKVDKPGNPPGGGGASGGGSQKCFISGTDIEVPCYRDDFGSWDGEFCYAKKLDPQPSWAGEGTTIYELHCPVIGSGDPPTQFDRVLARYRDLIPLPGVTPAALAQRAVDSMTLRGPNIQTTPRVGRAYVGLPVWLWTTRGPTRWGPNSATASVPGLSVTAVAKATQIVWSMGDGRSVTCRNPGTPYQRDAGRSSPTCGYTYQRPSTYEPGRSYNLTATTTWRITWRGGGESGTLTQSRTTTAAIPVGELQALITG